jgi:hypothetical protein
MHSSIVPARQIQRFLPGLFCLALTIVFGVSLDAETGRAIWTTELPGEPRPWGLAIDRHGRLIITLMDGRLVCLGGA